MEQAKELKTVKIFNRDYFALPNIIAEARRVSNELGIKYRINYFPYKSTTSGIRDYEVEFYSTS